MRHSDALGPDPIQSIRRTFVGLSGFATAIHVEKFVCFTRVTSRALA
jgi:hypothetical protein